MCFNLSSCAIFAISAYFLVNLLITEDQVWNGEVGSFESTQTLHIKYASEGDVVAVVKFSDHIVDLKDALSYSQQFNSIIQKVGEKYTKMVLSVHESRVELFRLTLTALFLKTVAKQNEIRERKKLETIQVFLHIPIKSFLDQNNLSETQALSMSLISYIGNGGIISGVIFETSLIQTPKSADVGAYGKGMNMTMSSTIVKFKKLLKSLRLTFGHELKMGLAVNSYDECITCLGSDLVDVVSSLDMVVLNVCFVDDAGASCHGNEEQDAAYFANCVKVLQKKFKRLEFSHVGEIFDIKN